MREINMCIVAGTHGDEYEFGSRVQRQIETAVPGRAYMLTGNPRATRQGVRFIDSDLNRAFSGEGDGYEAERALEIKELFEREQFTHVVDLHTSPTTHSIVPIIPAECKKGIADTVINAIPSIFNIVELPATDKPHSLVSSVGKAGVALECPRYMDSAIANRIGKGLIDVVKHIGYYRLPRSIYRVTGNIHIALPLPATGIADFERLPGPTPQVAFVAAPAIYKQLGYGHQGMTVEYQQERSI